MNEIRILKLLMGLIRMHNAAFSTTIINQQPIIRIAHLAMFAEEGWLWPLWHVLVSHEAICHAQPKLTEEVMAHQDPVQTDRWGWSQTVVGLASIHLREAD